MSRRRFSFSGLVSLILCGIVAAAFFYVSFWLGCLIVSEPICAMAFFVFVAIMVGLEEDPWIWYDIKKIFRQMWDVLFPVSDDNA